MNTETKTTKPYYIAEENQHGFYEVVLLEPAPGGQRGKIIADIGPRPNVNDSWMDKAQAKAYAEAIADALNKQAA